MVPGTKTDPFCTGVAAGIGNVCLACPGAVGYAFVAGSIEGRQICLAVGSPNAEHRG